MDDTEFINLEIYLTGLNLLYSFTQVHSNGTCLRIRHQTSWSQYLSQSSHFRHYTWHGDNNIDIRPTAFYLGNVLIQANIISSGSLSLFLFIRSTQNKNSLGLTRTMRQGNNTSHHLIGFTRVNTQTNIQIKRSIKLCESNVLDNLYGFLQRVLFCNIELS